MELPERQAIRPQQGKDTAMRKTSKIMTIASGMLMCSALATTAYAQSSCCPGGGNGSPIAIRGFGESAPVAKNLSSNASVRIYQFERNGVTYLQINDPTGQVRGAVGRIENTAWVTPMGKDVDRMSIVETLDKNRGSVVYDARYFTVQLASTTNGDAWTVTIKK
ncbi:hypothetical protein LZE81_14720 [Xanthomonas translucens]|nr:hypothetical protein [Xanthomonas translucens]UII59552.1 hypothetical protein LZE81_14720 [Xanthomonas translucens]